MLDALFYGEPGKDIGLSVPGVRLKEAADESLALAPVAAFHLARIHLSQTERRQLFPGVIHQGQPGSTLGEGLRIVADGNEVLIPYLGLGTCFTQHGLAVTADHQPLGQIVGQLGGGTHVPADVHAAGLVVFLCLALLLGDVDVQGILPQQAAPEAGSVVGFELLAFELIALGQCIPDLAQPFVFADAPEELQHLLYILAIQAVPVLPGEGIDFLPEVGVTALHIGRRCVILLQNALLVFFRIGQQQLAALLDAHLGLGQLLVEAVGVVGAEDGGPEACHVENMPLAGERLLSKLLQLLLRGHMADGDGVGIGAMGDAQPEQGLQGIAAQIHHDLIGIAQRVEHHMEQTEIVFPFFIVYVLRQDLLLNTVFELVDIDRFIRVSGNAAVADILLDVPENILGPVLIAHGPMIRRKVILGFDLLLHGHMGGLVHADADDVADLVHELLVGLGVLGIIVDLVGLAQDAHPVAAEAMLLLDPGSHMAVVVDDALTGLFAVHHTVHRIDHQRIEGRGIVFVGHLLVIAGSQAVVQMIADLLPIPVIDHIITKRILFRCIFIIFLRFPRDRPFIYLVVIGEPGVLEIAEAEDGVGDIPEIGIANLRVTLAEPDAIVFEELSAPGIGVDVMLEHFADAVQILDLLFFSVREFCGCRLGPPLLQKPFGTLGETHLVEALVVADGQDQLAEGGRHAEFIEHIGVLHGNIHDDQVGDLHLLANPVADDVVGFRIGIRPDHPDVLYRDPLIPFFLGDIILILGHTGNGRGPGFAGMVPVLLLFQEQELFQGFNEAAQLPFVHNIRHIGEVHDHECVDLVFVVKLLPFSVNAALLGAKLTGHKTPTGMDAVLGRFFAIRINAFTGTHQGSLLILIQSYCIRSRDDFQHISIIFLTKRTHLRERGSEYLRDSFPGKEA